jgi:hypothetical protein
LKGFGVDADDLMTTVERDFLEIYNGRPDSLGEAQLAKGANGSARIWVSKETRSAVSDRVQI